MKCPICHENGANVRWSDSGRWIECTNCDRHIYEHEWYCPVCATRNHRMHRDNQGQVISCTNCNLKDHYIKKEVKNANMPVV